MSQPPQYTYQSFPLKELSRMEALLFFVVYSALLNASEITLSVLYYYNENVLFFGGTITNIIYGWLLFAYMCIPAFLLFATRL